MTVALSSEGLIRGVQFICRRLTLVTVLQSREKQKHQNKSNKREETTKRKY